MTELFATVFFFAEHYRFIIQAICYFNFSEVYVSGTLSNKYKFLYLSIFTNSTCLLKKKTRFFYLYDAFNKISMSFEYNQHTYGQSKGRTILNQLVLKMKFRNFSFSQPIICLHDFQLTAHKLQQNKNKYEKRNSRKSRTINELNILFSPTRKLNTN